MQQLRRAVAIFEYVFAAALLFAGILSALAHTVRSILG
ncbi:hypothetical protein FHS97_000980 [Sphingomonas endophytica]|uniref:Uncharacterized protein n=1 Tax=Sphingomonas endophytica TaxID=869719 RepID=A0ABR6N2Q9_9SPHN|nr:hypothetical protein [Sphingomonas endophytica]